ncbi:MAG: hypothetical protein M1816_003306 [Peltula sp. TS41687]|nr:MAG: hypothetical protein M1816_003306 [Peltula sp. TS41687]
MAGYGRDSLLPLPFYLTSRVLWRFLPVDKQQFDHPDMLFMERQLMRPRISNMATTLCAPSVDPGLQWLLCCVGLWHMSASAAFPLVDRISKLRKSTRSTALEVKADPVAHRVDSPRKGSILARYGSIPPELKDEPTNSPGLALQKQLPPVQSNARLVDSTKGQIPRKFWPVLLKSGLLPRKFPGTLPVNRLILQTFPFDAAKAAYSVVNPSLDEQGDVLGLVRVAPDTKG